jgi:hypothetical protein
MTTIPPGPVWLADEALGATVLGLVATLGLAAVGREDDKAGTEGLAKVIDGLALPLPQAAKSRLKSVTANPSWARRAGLVSSIDRTFRRSAAIDSPTF